MRIQLAAAFALVIAASLGMTSNALALGAAPNASCQGIAPAQTHCSTGLHDEYAHATHNTAHGAPGQPGITYTGTIVSRLTWEIAPGLPIVHEQVSCVVDGISQSCQSPILIVNQLTNLFVPPGVVVQHDCFSYNLDTTAPGGSGLFACVVGEGSDLTPLDLDSRAAGHALLRTR